MLYYLIVILLVVHSYTIKWSMYWYTMKRWLAFLPWPCVDAHIPDHVLHLVLPFKGVMGQPIFFSLDYLLTHSTEFHPLRNILDLQQLLSSLLLLPLLVGLSPPGDQIVLHKSPSLCCSACTLTKTSIFISICRYNTYRSLGIIWCEKIFV